MESRSLTIVSVAALVLTASVYGFLLVNNAPRSPVPCQPNESGDCLLPFSMVIDDKSLTFDSFPITRETKPVQFDGVRFAYTGSSTPEKDGVNCTGVFPRAFNSTVGHHPPIVVPYGGYFQINETRHFEVKFADGLTESLVLCWNGLATPKVIQMSDSGLGGPMFCPQKTTWFDKDKTAGIVQDEYCSRPGPYYDTYIARAKG